ncbi:MAG: glycine--tRNA ligase, partial [Candidatus Thermoplasmatota archaeon]
CVECEKCGESFKVDNLVGDIPEGIGKKTLAELGELIKEKGIKCIDCGGKLSEPYAFNLMFKTQIGKNKIGFLRPETAQGIFLNFRALYRYFREKLPFGVVQLGKGYRNEVSPRQGLLRLREFNMAEAEIFVTPNGKAHHPKFGLVANDNLVLLPDSSTTLTITVEDAVKKGIINNTWLAYHIALSARFLVDIGIEKSKLRFRKHAKHEMAHYATECWDCEVETSLGWLEVVGVADRGSYDLQAHMNYSKVELTALEPYDVPKTVEKEVVKIKMDTIEGKWKKEMGLIKNLIQANNDEIVDYAKKNSFIILNIHDDKLRVGEYPEGTNIRLEKENFEIAVEKSTVAGVHVIPHVIEPSYGIDRILYAIMEHSFTKERRNGEEYIILKFKPRIAPIKIGVFPLMPKDELIMKAREIDRMLRNERIITYYDEIGSIGRRYARMDEIGTPYCVTVDYDTIKDECVTIRDRDTTSQERVEIDELIEKIKNLMEKKK